MNSRWKFNTIHSPIVSPCSDRFSERLFGFMTGLAQCLAVHCCYEQRVGFSGSRYKEEAWPAEVLQTVSSAEVLRTARDYRQRKFFEQ